MVNINRSGFLGPILILLGIFMFVRGGISFNTSTLFTIFWPVMFVIPVGVFFHWLYFSMLQRRGVGLLVPGGIIFTAGLVCQFSTLFHGWGVTWPGFILAVAVGLFELYWFGGRNKWLLIPINILTVLSILFFVIFSIGYIFGSLLHGQPFIAAALIVLGGVLMFARKEKKNYL